MVCHCHGFPRPSARFSDSYSGDSNSGNIPGRIGPCPIHKAEVDRAGSLGPPFLLSGHLETLCNSASTRRHAEHTGQWY